MTPPNALSDLNCRPRMRLEHGTIILESAFNQNITFWARGRGSVNMHTETGIYSLSHQMVGANTDMITRLESLEQSMRNSLALADQLTALREQVQEIVRMILSNAALGVLLIISFKLFL